MMEIIDYQIYRGFPHSTNKANQEKIEELFEHYLPKQTRQQKINFYGDFDDISLRMGQEDLPSEEKTRNINRPVKLLSVSISDLSAQLEDIKLKSATKEEKTRANNESQVQDSQLWVDKYSPQSYMNLLTNAQTNLKVITWLKSWDEVIDPSVGKVNLKQPQFLQSKKNPLLHQSKSRQSQFMEFDEIHSFVNKRILMLHGPAGCGKSTMARVISTQAGYNPQIVNASDCRSGQQLVGVIQNALEMDSVSFDKQKPTCLILDEIDGALGGEGEMASGMSLVADFLKKALKKSQQKKKEKTVETEVAMCSDSSAEFVQVAKTSKKKDPTPALIRPIIMICNDFYAKALRPLREQVLAIKVQEADQQSLIDRMKDILKKEGKDKGVDSSFLKKIIEEANGDARSCLNAIQYLSKTNNLNLKAHNLLIGKKDQQISLMSACEFLMFERPVSKIRGENQLSRIQTLIFNTTEDIARINGCLFENYLACCQFYDDMLHRTNLFLDLVSLHEVQDSLVGRTQNYSLKAMEYLAAAAFKIFCADFKAGRIQFPKLFYQMYTDKRKYQEIIEHIVGYKMPKVQKTKSAQLQDMVKVGGANTGGIPKSKFLTDILPLVGHCIVLELKNEQLALLTNDEKRQLNMLIQMMAELDIKLMPPRGEEDPPLFEPDLLALIRMNGNQQQEKSTMTRQMQLLIRQTCLTYQRMISLAIQNGTILTTTLNPLQAVGPSSGMEIMLAGQKAQIEAEKKKKRAACDPAFIYKFREGHSKNFKKDATFDFFLK